MPPSLKTQQWVKKAKARWLGINESGYSKVVYERSDKRVLIYCPDCKYFIYGLVFEKYIVCD